MILFITRKHPPGVGGMEKLSYEMILAVSALTPTRVIAWRGPRKGWPLFAIAAFFRGLWACLSRPVAFIHVSDPVLAPLGWLLARLTRRRWGLTAHGLDVLYPSAVYQTLVLPFVRRADAVVAISAATRDACLSKGVRPERCTAIPVGLALPLPEAERGEASARLRATLGATLDGPMLLTVGRLVRRKGAAWFVEQVLPAIVEQHENVTYLVAGEGPERAAILDAARRSGTESRVLLLGRVSDDTLKDLYAVATLFIMPNIRVEGDMEGFGIVAIEAAARGLPVVAARIDGIPDAIQDGENGVLVTAGDAAAWLSAVDLLLSDLERRNRLAARAREFTREHYRWEHLAPVYLQTFGVVADGKADWDRAYLHVRRGAKRRMKRLQAFEIPRNARILDYGCGDGINARLLLQFGYTRIVSVDYSLRLLRAGQPPNPVAADAHRTPFADAAFDAVLVDGVLHHLEPERALREIRRLLAPDGALYLVEPAGSTLRTLLDRVTFSPLSLLWRELRHRRVSLAEEWDTYRAWLKIERRLPEMMTEAGLHAVSVKRTPLNLVIIALPAGTGMPGRTGPLV